MAAVTHLTGNEPGLAAIVRAAFPGYSGRMFKLSITDPDTAINCAGSWDGGSRDYFAFVDLATLQSVEAPAQSAFDPQMRGLRTVKLSECPANLVIVEHSIFCGRDHGITIHARAESVMALLPAAVELSREQRIVLAATAGLKSSYAGIKDYRFSEAHQDTGITREAYDTAKAACIAAGYLNKAGAITVSGRNAIGSTRLDQLRVAR